MHDLAEFIVLHLEKHQIITPSSDEREIYVYGFDIALYTLFSTLGLLLLGLLLGYPMEALMMISLFYVNQTLGGGFHASTHLSCFLVMCAGLVVFIMLLSLPLPKTLSAILGIGSLALLFTHPLILHKNKQFLAPKGPLFIKRSRIASCIQFILFMLLLALSNAHYSQTFAVALTLCAASRMTAHWQRKGSSFLARHL